MKSPENVLLIIRRSLGDVLALSPIIDILTRRFPNVFIDLLVNKDTIAAAKLLNNINAIIPFDKKLLAKTSLGATAMQAQIIVKIFRKYDLAISFESNERSNILAYLAGRTSAGIRELSFYKNWWHKMLLDVGYHPDQKRHILEKNTQALSSLGIHVDRVILSARYSSEAKKKAQQTLKDMAIERFIIFHPAGKYLCKLYPEKPRNLLLQLLDSLDIPIIVTGGKSTTDQQVASAIPKLKNVHSVIGRISLEECAALTDISLAYVGVDTFNCHLAAAFNKPIFVMFGPTNPEVWSPWSNALQRAGQRFSPVQSYGDITVFQSSLECVPCGHSARCGEQDRLAACMAAIEPHTVFNEVKNWLFKSLPESRENAKSTILRA